MASLDSIIEINISRQTTPVDRAAFNIPCFIGEFNTFQERAREYTSLAAVEEDFGTEGAVYKAAAKFFGQEIRPPRIVIGRKIPDDEANPDSESWVDAVSAVEFENNT